MVRKAGWVIGCLMVGIAGVSCGSSDDNRSSGSGVGAGEDAGRQPPIFVVPGGDDAGQGVDSGPVDAGPPPPPLQIGGFTHYTMAHGLPETVRDVSADEAGNVWVAGYDGLYLLRPSADRFEKFGQAQGLQQWKVLSVAGLGPNEVAVGYEGVFGGMEDYDPEWMKLSGGVDRVRLKGNLLETEHWVIGTPSCAIDPVNCSSSYPDGRYKMRSIHIIRPMLSGPFAGDLWFGGTHGVAQWNARQDTVIEHVHAAINGPDKTGSYTLLSGDWFGLAFDASWNVWIGAAHREARIPYARSGNFWEDFDLELDLWPDVDDVNRTDDHVSSMAVDTSGAVWVGSMKNNLARYDPATGAITYYSRATGTPDKAVLSLAADPDGSVWVGTWIGLGRTKGGQWTSFHSYDVRLPSDEIHSLQIDTRTSPRTLYIGMPGGVSIYRGP